MGTIYIVNILHAKMTSFIFENFCIQILIHFISYYSIAVDGISVPNTSNEQHTESQDTAGVCDSYKYRITSEMFTTNFIL